MSKPKQLKAVDAPKLITKANRMLLQFDGLTAKEALFVLMVMSNSVISAGWRNAQDQADTADKFNVSLKANLALGHKDGGMMQ